jgi:hypothetical protein
MKKVLEEEIKMNSPHKTARVAACVFLGYFSWGCPPNFLFARACLCRETPRQLSGILRLLIKGVRINNQYELRLD